MSLGDRPNCIDAKRPPSPSPSALARIRRSEPDDPSYLSYEVRPPALQKYAHRTADRARSNAVQFLRHFDGS